MKNLFSAAIAMDRDSLDQFVEKACGSDRLLRRELQVLLYSHFQLKELETRESAAEGDEIVTIWDAEGASIGGRFRVIRKLGSGGFGDVYEAFDSKLNLAVAVKRLRDSSPSALARFKREFRMLAKFRHPGVVQLYELIQEADQWFFTMELLPGTDFLGYVRSPFLVHYGKLRAAMLQLAEGIHALHRSRILHRDIKPSNVRVTPNGRVVLLDFGLVKQIETVTVMDSHSRTLVGTPGYLAPEQITQRKASEASDWYSAGVLLYVALTGRSPYDGSPLEMMLNQRMEDPVPPHKYVESTPADLASLCMDLLRREPEERPDGDDILRRLRGAAVATIRPPAAHLEDPKMVFASGSHELQALTESVETVRSGRPAAVRIRESSDIGKTRLAERFLESIRIACPEALVLKGRCYDNESVPYKALDDLVDALCRHMRRLTEQGVDAILPRNFRLLTRIFPVLGYFVSAGQAINLGETMNPAEKRRRALEALKELFGRLAERSLLVIFIEDLQWGDLASIRFLNHLMGPSDPPPLLLLLSYRQEGQDSILDTLSFAAELDADPRQPKSCRGLLTRC